MQQRQIFDVKQGGCRQTPPTILWFGWVLFECSSFDYFPLRGLSSSCVVGVVSSMSVVVLKIDQLIACLKVISESTRTACRQET